MRAWIPAYDIRDHKRLQRVRRMMCKHAAPLEYSVFWLEGTDADLARCVRLLLPLLALDLDDLRIYAVPKRGLRLRLGAPPLPTGIFWTGMPARGWSESLRAALMHEDHADSAATGRPRSVSPAGVQRGEQL